MPTSKKPTSAKRGEDAEAAAAADAGTRSAEPKGENAAFDNVLFPPRLDRLELPEAKSAGTGPEYEDILESICGVADDSQAVEQYNGTLGVTEAFVDAHQKPVAQVQWNDNLASIFTNPGDVSGVRWGSGTMIGPDLFLTCGHLFDPNPDDWTIPRQNGTSNPISPQDAAINMHLNFLFQVDESGVQRPEQRFAITSLIEYRLGGLDMALCRVAGNPGNIFGWTEFATTNASVGDMLAIIGHPAGRPKRIEAGPCTSLTGSRIRYNDIDTLGGNSGSGILHGATGRLVGVHTNGGCNSAGTGSNSGVAIAAIVAASPTLQATTPSSRTARADDLIATPLAADVAGTRLGADTARLQDQLATRLAEDLQTTVRALDTGVTDQLGTRLTGDFGTLLGRDVGTFGSGDDPNLTTVEQILNPGSVVLPPFRRMSGSARPFVQAAPSVESAEPEAGDASLGAAVLAELEGVIAAQAASLAALEALHAALEAMIQEGES